MERDKSRGLKHIKDKQKYKNRSTNNPKYATPKQRPNLGSNLDRYGEEDEVDSHKNKPNLGSNLDRYERKEVQSEFKLDESVDFALLSQLPITSGSHFISKTDKLIFEETETEQLQNVSDSIFALDLSMLQQSILTVPFYERIGIDKSYFSPNQIEQMSKEAEVAKHRYNMLYKPDTNSHIKEVSNQNINSVEEQIQNKLINMILTKDDEKDIVDEISIPENPVKIEEPLKLSSKMDVKDVKEVKENNEDLEKWLDDFLDE